MLGAVCKSSNAERIGSEMAVALQRGKDIMEGGAQQRMGKSERE